MSFTTRQLGANRVNRMPGAPVTCETTHYELSAFDGVIKGTVDGVGGGPQKLKCTNTGILKVDIVNQEEGATSLIVDNKNLDQVIKDIDGSNDKLLLIGGQKTTDKSYNLLQLDNSGNLNVSVQGGGFDGTVANPALTKLVNALHNHDDDTNFVAGDNTDNILVVGGIKKTTDENDAEIQKYDTLNLNDNGDLNVFLEGATQNSKNDSLGNKYLVIGGRTDTNTDNPATATFKELKVTDTGALEVSLSLDSETTLNTDLDDALGDTGIDDGENVTTKFLAIGGRVYNSNDEEQNSFKELKVSGAGVLDVNIDNNDLQVKIKEAGNDANSVGQYQGTNDPHKTLIGDVNVRNKIIIHAVDNTDNTGQGGPPIMITCSKSDNTNSTSLNVIDERLVDCINNDGTKLNVTSDDLAKLSETVAGIGASEIPTKHLSVCGKSTDVDANTPYVAVKVDKEGVVCVKTNGTDTVTVKNDVLTSLNAVFENEEDPATGTITKYLRVIDKSQRDGILMKGDDAAGGTSNQTISLVQGGISPSSVDTVINKPRLLTANIGRNITYVDDVDLNGSGAMFKNPTDISGGGGGELTPYLGKILLENSRFPKTEGSMINVYVRIICPDGTTVGEDDPRPFTIYILGGTIEAGSKFYTVNQTLVLDSILIDETFQQKIHSDPHAQTGGNNIFYHTFKLNMPFGKNEGLGISSNKDLTNVYVGMSHPEY
jgi:hypothetical protein